MSSPYIEETHPKYVVGAHPDKERKIRLITCLFQDLMLEGLCIGIFMKDQWGETWEEINVASRSYRLLIAHFLD